MLLTPARGTYNRCLGDSSLGHRLWQACRSHKVLARSGCCRSDFCFQMTRTTSMSTYSVACFSCQTACMQKRFNVFRANCSPSPALLCLTLVCSADREAAAIAALEQERQGLKDDRAHVSKLRTQLEQASTRLEQEKAAWDRQKASLHQSALHLMPFLLLHMLLIRHAYM